MRFSSWRFAIRTWVVRARKASAIQPYSPIADKSFIKSRGLEARPGAANRQLLTVTANCKLPTANRKPTTCSLGEKSAVDSSPHHFLDPDRHGGDSMRNFFFFLAFVNRDKKFPKHPDNP